ncbi:hypothetical protein [Streptomyces scopuliridis]|uniref:hypothetical protein n=1 Tax=Streptomyces scopuliridis TaxID=452529 RepID=UPI0036B1D451
MVNEPAGSLGQPGLDAGLEDQRMPALIDCAGQLEADRGAHGTGSLKLQGSRSGQFS